MSDQNTLERRRQERRTVQTSARVRAHGACTYRDGMAVDVSLDGLGLLLSDAPAQGSSIHVNCGFCWLEGTVSYCVRRGEGYYVGVQLNFRSPSDRFPYQQVVARLQRSA